MIEQAESSLEISSLHVLTSTYHYFPVKVEGAEGEKAFLEVPARIYRLDPFWIPPLEGDISSIFDVTKNPYFSHGQAARWIIVDKLGEPCGRIAAFINFNKQHEGDQRLGGIGFFECIDEKAAAHALFEVAMNWLVEGFQVNIVDGPINFGENDKYWGLLIKGNGPVSYGMNYNPSYYVALFNSFGFNIHYRQLTNYISLSSPLPERFSKIAARVMSSGRYNFQPMKYRNRQRFITDFVDIYNRAWSSFTNFHPIDASVVEKSLRDMRPIMIEELIWFAYSGKKPIGFLVAIPDVNEIIRYSGPKLDLWGKCKFMFYKWIKGFTTVRVVVMGIVPEYQNRGIESALILRAFNEGRKRPQLKHVQLSWVGDFNDRMMAIHKAMHSIECTQHATLRKVL
ncbi:MAG: GNAT family N-acetyltransferase [Bacteroidota bacterium]